MIKGRVTASHEPVIKLALVSTKKRITCDAVVDTGFNGYISVPLPLARELDWIHIGYEEYEIARGEIVKQAVYLGNVVFHGKCRDVYAVTSNSKDVLIGTKLLAGCILTINFRARRLTLK